MTDGIRILIVDDQSLIRVGFRMVLESEDDLTVVGEASDGDEALAAVVHHRPDVVLMDVRMPALDGIEATRRIVARHPQARVLVLTTFDLDEYAFGALEAGASGFLLKDAQPHELVAAVRAVHRGDAMLSPRVTRRLLELVGGRLPETAAAPPAGIAALTDRETDVFRAMGRGRTNAEIAKELFVSESTVKTHVGRVLAKLGARDRVQAVIVAHRHGYADPEDPPPAPE
ncbi:response regulator transcription factor [Microbacterium sp.]|uniref:response regulator transcription factor n=1 Tax=Microbacterium sp. TaxID=51671 RepID=UPI0039E2D067